MRQFLFLLIPFLPVLAACTGKPDSPPATRAPDVAAVAITQTALYAQQATQIAVFRTPHVTQTTLSAADTTGRIATFDGVEMALVPPGCFEMGSDGGQSDEVPAHRQCFDAPFYIDRFEVSNEQFIRLGGQAAEPGRWTDPDHPREQVTWFEARDFCAGRGDGVRLPTEAEWEYAARGPEGPVFPWGDTLIPDNVVYIDNTGSQTAPVGSRPGGASWVGAQDMSGNVKEWVSTIYSTYLPYPYTASDKREDPANTTERRTLRGGSFLSTWGELRAFSREGSYPHYTGSDIGFRCARAYP